MEAVCSNRDHPDSSRQSEQGCGNTANEATSPRPYWKYLQDQNRSDTFVRHDRRACEVYSALRGTELESAKSTTNLGSAKVGDVSPVREPPPARFAETYMVARIVGMGRVIDVVG